MSEFFSETESTAGTSSSSFDESSVFSVSLENFNLTELLRKHPILVSSDTQKYDSKDQDTNSSCSSTSSGGGGGGGGNSMAMSGQMSEKLKQQRHLLNLKLGIDVGGAAKLDTTEIFTDYDIMSSTVYNDSELASGGGGSDTFDPNRAKRRLPDVPGVVIFYFDF